MPGFFRFRYCSRNTILVICRSGFSREHSAVPVIVGDAQCSRLKFAAEAAAA